MPTRLDINTRVDAPIEELFDLMADPETEVDWNPDAIEVRRIDQRDRSRRRMARPLHDGDTATILIELDE